MMKEPVTITFRNIILKTEADDGFLNFTLESKGEAVIEMDPDTLDKITELLEEEAAA